MPFLHGFRRTIFEYQPLVEDILRTIGVKIGTEDLHIRLVPTVSVRSNEDELDRSRLLVDLLERECNSEVFAEGISFSLFKVAALGLEYAAKILVSFGADVNFEDPVTYYSPLHIAVLRNRSNMVRLLVGLGANIEKRDRVHQSSPLDLASEESEKMACLRTLLELGANVNARDAHGKTALLHAIESCDGVNVLNVENIKLLLEKGADVHATTVQDETIVSSLVYLIKDAPDATEVHAARVGNYCLKITKLLMDHGSDPSCCLNQHAGASLTQMALERFDLYYPLAVLLIQSRVSLVCSYHSEPCWSAYSLIFQRLQTALQHCADKSHATDLLEKAEKLVDLMKTNAPLLRLSSRLKQPLPCSGSHPYAQALLDLHDRVVELEASPPSLKSLCRAFLRSHLEPPPVDDRVRALPLPDVLKDFLLPETTCTAKPGWGCFKSRHSPN
ncbi:ankyrin repeat and SOCS box protein 6 [Pholidichthys leucotaenia]